MNSLLDVRIQVTRMPHLLFEASQDHRHLSNLRPPRHSASTSTKPQTLLEKVGHEALNERKPNQIWLDSETVNPQYAPSDALLTQAHANLIWRVLLISLMIGVR